MEEDCAPAADLDCPSLLCEELVDLESKKHQGRMSRRQRMKRRGKEKGEGVFGQREDGVAREEEKGEDETIKKKVVVLSEREEEVQVKRVSGPQTEEAQEVQMEDKQAENTRETGADKQESKVSKSLEETDQQKKSRKKQAKKKNEQARKRRGGVKDISQMCEEEKLAFGKEAVPEMSLEESSDVAEPSMELMNTCDLTDVGFTGSDLYCPSVLIPSLYSSQPHLPIQPPHPPPPLIPLPPHSTKRPHSPVPPLSLPQQAPQSLEMEITQVYSTRRSIRYRTRGRGRGLSFNLMPGLESIEPHLLPPPPKKKSRTLYTSTQIEHLEALFHEDHYPDTDKRKVIAAVVGVTPQRIMVWFQNRRAKWRKEFSISAKVVHNQSLAECSGSSPNHPINPTQGPIKYHSTAPSKAALSTHFPMKLPTLAPAMPSCPAMPTQTSSSYRSTLASINSPGQHQLSSQGGLANCQPRPMHSPPPLQRASLPLFTVTCNPSNPAPPPLNTPSSTPPVFLEALEAAGSSVAHHDSQPLQSDTSSLFDLVEKLDYLSSSQHSNTFSYQLQTSFPSSQPQHPPQTSVPHMAYLTPSPYLAPNPPDVNSNYLTLGPGGNSTGLITYSAGGYFQSQSSRQILLQSSTGHSGGVTAFQSYPWSNMYNQPALHQHSHCPPTYSSTVGSARDLQTPSTSSLPVYSLFSQRDHGPPSHTQTQSSATTSTTSTTTDTSSSSRATVLPPASALLVETTPAKVLPPQVSSSALESPPAPPCDKLQYDSPREIHSHFHCDFSPLHF